MSLWHLFTLGYRRGSSAGANFLLPVVSSGQPIDICPSPTHKEKAYVVMAFPPLPTRAGHVLDPCSYDISTTSQDSI